MVRLIQSQAFLLWVVHLVLRLFFFWLYPLPPPPPLTRDLSQESSFCPFFSLGNQCFIDLSVLFHPAAHQCFIDLSLIWISNWCRLEWQSFHIQEKQPGVISENRWKRKPSPSLQVSFYSNYLFPREFWLFLIRRNVPREFCNFGADQIIDHFPLVSTMLIYFVAFHR